jgi:hypothetical protein
VSIEGAGDQRVQVALEVREVRRAPVVGRVLVVVRRLGEVRMELDAVLLLGQAEGVEDDLVDLLDRAEHERATRRPPGDRVRAARDEPPGKGHGDLG